MLLLIENITLLSLWNKLELGFMHCITKNIFFKNNVMPPNKGDLFK